MRLGILADIHDDVSHLHGALAELSRHAVDQVVVLGDTITSSGLTNAAEVARLLEAAGAIGVWGNHDMGLCHHTSDELRRLYAPEMLAFMSRMQPQFDVEGCFFSHVDPWLDPRDLAQLWYFGGPPDTPEKAVRSFATVPHRFLFLGHFHRWLLMTPSDRIAWDGTAPVLLGEYDRCLVVVAPVFTGHCAVFDTEHAQLTPSSRCEVLDDMAALRDGRVLILEDDVISGLTLRLTVSALKEYGPHSFDLYLGRQKENQLLENAGPEIGTIYIAEDYLDPVRRAEHELEFVNFLGKNMIRQ